MLRNAIVRYLLLATALVVPAASDEWNKSTRVPLTEATKIGDFLLPPGVYRFRLASSSSDRHILQVFDEKTGQLMLQTFAVPSYRLKITDRPEISFWEGKRGEVRALRSWFYAADHEGLEFPASMSVIATAPAAPSVPALSSPTPQQFPLRPALFSTYYREKWALVVGVSKAETAIFDLPFGRKDALDIANMLLDPEVGRFTPDSAHVRVLVDRQATRVTIEQQILTLAALAGPRDLVVIYFSVHGVLDRQNGRRYLSTFDIRATDLDHTAFEMGSFVALLGKYFRAQVVVLLDACDSGAVKAVSKGLTLPPPSAPLVPSNVVVISSSQDSEDSYVSNRWQNSFFTRAVLDAMYGTQGTLTLADLFTRLSLYVPAAVRAETGNQQHPVMLATPLTETLTLGSPPKE
ncbi:MAG TPA: caspase family protein [Bryobacteraceae bacterium]|jgi:hypothetical protein